MKIAAARIIGKEHCDIHDRTYNIWNTGDQIKCPDCYQTELDKRTTEFIQLVEKAHQDAAKSTVVFGQFFEPEIVNWNKPYYMYESIHQLIKEQMND